MLVIADDYDPETETPLAEMVSRHHLDAIITAGNLSQPALADIDTLDVPAMGVYGNHCDGTYLATLGVTDLHLNRVELQGISFVGYKAASDTRRAATTSCTPRMNTARLSMHFPPPMSSSPTARREASTTTPTPLTSGSTRCATG